MKSLAWMPLFGDDFWESERVALMDDSASLLYQWLLWRQFKHGPLPPAETLRRLPHRWQHNWTRTWPQVAECFEALDDGRLSNPRCAEEREKMLARVNLAREKGAKGGKARAKPQLELNQSPGSTSAQALTGPDITENPPTPRTRGKRAARAPGIEASLEDIQTAFAAQPQLDAPQCRDAWQRWMRARREMGEPVTPSEAAETIAGYGTRGPSAFLAAIDFTIPKGWKGLADPKPSDLPGLSKQPPSAPPETAEQLDVRERWNLRESRRVARGEARGVRKFPGFDQAMRELNERQAS